MLNKLLVVFVLGVVLIGCDTDNSQVTEYMLIGNWKCDKLFSKYERYYDDHVEDASDQFEDQYSFRVDFTKESNSTMESIDYKDPVPFKLNDEGNDEFEKIDDCNFDAASEFKMGVKYIYVSNDEFKKQTTIQFRTCESKKIFIDGYKEYLCKRIK